MISDQDAPLTTNCLTSFKSGVMPSRSMENPGIVTLDISKGFGQESHQGLLNKLPASI